MTKLRVVFLVPIFMIIAFHSHKGNSDPIVPALYIFGDSLFDSGNNNLLPTLAKADFQPYGMSFNRGATGRFTNGRTLVDFIAEFLGLPYPPPYLSIVRAVLQSNQSTGLNFASGSCGILSETGNDLGKCLNFPEQVNMFERTVEVDLPRHYQNSDELSSYLSRSLYVISIGSNDYINNYLDTQHYDTSKRYSPQAFAELLINEFSLQLQRLYQLGARKVVMFEIGPIGCIPSIVRQNKPNGRCDENVNQLAIIFNNKLAAMLQNLTSTLVGSDFILGHGHWLGYDAVINPSKYGLVDSITPCCRTWFNGTSACIPELWTVTCKNPESHYFWDGYHLTETIYRTIALRCITGSSVCIPKSIQDLVLQP